MTDGAQVIQLDSLVERATDGIVSKVVFAGPEARTVLFTFDAGQELTAHRAAGAAILHVLDGTARIELGEAVHEAGAGTWIYLPPELEHAVRAITPLTMLLTLVGDRRGGS